MAAAKERNAAPRRRVAVDDDSKPAAASYFAQVGDKGTLHFFSSGCAGVDAALGGGWPLGRVSNIVGDKSSGKTLLAIEGSANFAHTFPSDEEDIFYREAEAAFDKSYAATLGLPMQRVQFRGKDYSSKKPWKMETIEDFYEDANRVLDQMKDRPALYIVDSLDALSDDAEMKREFGDGSYGGSKPKKLGELFRRLVQRIEEQQMHLMVISQLRDKLNVTFGETKTRSGGRALDFYASHIMWLAETGKIKRTIDKVERVVGLDIKARVKKNKVGLAHREFAYPLLFGYGIDDLTANVEWLLEVGADTRLREELGISAAGYKVMLRNIRDKGGEEARTLRAQLRAMLFDEWQRVESKFLPTAPKY